MCDKFKNSRDSIRKLTPNEIDPEILKQYQDNMNKELAKKPKPKKKY